MNPEACKALEEYKDAINKYGRFMVYARGIEFQKYSVKKLNALRESLAILKEKLIEAADEESANTILSLEALVNANVKELEMLILLKEDKMEAAWGALVESQYSLRASFQASNIVFELDGQNYMNKLYLVEKLFFPPQVYMSIEVVVDKTQCSICNGEYGSCNHVVGKPYNGRICHRIVTKIKETKGAAILVEREPGNKLCKVNSFTDNGHWRNRMTWRIERK